eukprot:CAMPEP_0184496932 /NCGR_PEP_ID=MMETSP0113_2-20130426/35261_1 /TAXON_ID=91329 /ORGANISM="Norrisiella sphaerica, Strain BC52" /LENGTH=733 /DNA_ID=CAMNT_0026883805 /DNA_START=6 /DNA_END=2207 /DNA_ORIENTATION=-
MEFQAEVNRLMDIIINSLYSNREIFIRELISNASDALDKIRFESLKDKDAVGQVPLEIRIKYDQDAKTLTISDTGVGMSKDDLVKNLGTVAKSGTTDFVEKAASGTDSLSLIGQFGVGFYSVYLVSDEVTVVSKKNEFSQHVWKSSANQTFSVAPDPRGDTLPRGTSVTLKMKEDADEFLNPENLEKLIKKYSQFIQFPIYLHTHKTVSKEVPIEEEEKPEEADTEKDAESDDDLEVADEEDDNVEKKPKTKTVQETVWEWKHINTNKPIWTRKPADIEEKEYIDFYKALTKDTDEPIEFSHFSAEGEISFKSILYVPKKAPAGYYDNYYKKSTALKLYVRKVLISEEFEDFMPRYLGFIKGVVDSEDLPLNVSRETLQQSKVLRVMSKKLTRKAIAMLRKMAEDCEDDEDEEDENEEEEDDAEGTEKECKFDAFYSEFGKSLKLGVLEDNANKKKLGKLLRYETSKSEGKLIGLQEYVENMPESQEHIYYITGESKDAVKNSPFIERLTRKGIEVVYMVDPLDEYIINAIPEFDGIRLQSVTKEDLEIAQSEAAKEKAKKLKEEFKPFSEWLATKLGKRVSKVEVSNRLAQSPCVLVTSKYGWSANMERIMKAQTLGSADSQPWMKASKILEINPNHPLIKELKERSQSDEDNELKNSVELLYTTALLSSGFPVEDPKAFAQNVHEIIAKNLGVDSLEVELEAEEPLDNGEDEGEEEEEEEEEEDSASKDEL